MIINKKSVTSVSITLTILLLLSLFLSPAISFAAKEDKAEPTKTQEIEGPSRSGSAPHLKSGITTSYTAYGIVNEEFGFSDHWMEYFFEDPENDTLSFYASVNSGTLSQNYFTVLTDENNNDVTTFSYTPASAGTYDIKIYANDGTSTSTSYLNITLTVEAANSNNRCYVNINIPASVNDFAVENASGETVSIGSGNTSGNVTTYETRIAKGTYTFEGKPSGSNQLSGMSFTVPAHAGAGTSSNPDVINIKQANISVKAGGTTQNVSNYTLTMRDADMNVVTPGHDTNSTTNVPYLVFANGNAELYSFEVVPGSSLSSYAPLYQGNQDFDADTVAENIELTLPTAVNYSITAPTDATVKVFRQIRNYQTMEVTDNGSPTTSNGNTTYTYRLPQNGSGYTYRVSKSGKITRAGFIPLSSAGSKTITFSTDSPSLTLAQATASSSQETNNIFGMTAGYDAAKTVGSRAEDSVLLNAHIGSNNSYSALYHNYINLNAESSYKIRGYRAAWQIINSDTANIMIEPDFHFQVVEGTATDLTLTQDSVHNSWCTVTPNTGASGVYVIKVTYDAIDVDGMSYSNNPEQRFYATAVGREGYLVVNVTDNNSDTYTDMALNAETNGSRDANMDWDSEIDTVYYTSSHGTFTFAPTASGKTISTVQFSTTPGTYSTITPSNGKYTVNPVQGYNMIKVTWDDNTVSYAPIRAAKIKILVDGTDLANNPTVHANENHTIKLEGVYIPVPKFSGIYNPMMNKANYTVGNSTVSGNNVQYNFITQNKITWKPTSTGTYNFTNGYHSMRMFCNTTAKWGHHRLLTDSGIGANFSAGLVNGVFNIYPDFSIIVS